MNVVVLGQGGREQALAQACLNSSLVERLYVIPGNAGMKLSGIECVDLHDEDQIVDFCKQEKIELVIPGNEKVILSCIKSKLQKNKIKCFSPVPEDAQLESSKIFCKKILEKAGLLTADYQVIQNTEAGLQAIKKHQFHKPLVLKADGLAQGKGVWVCADENSAIEALNRLSENFGFPILFEQCLVGKELSAFAICDQGKFSFLGTAVDYKRITSDPFSANTGGMGAFSPCDFLTPLDEMEIQHIFQKTLQQLPQYQGFLFAGLMKTDQGMAVIEFNVRMGDPETQALLPRLNSDFVQLILEPHTKCELKNEAAVHVVMTSEGYPSKQMSLGHRIQIANPQSFYFSGVQEKNGYLINSGGRVLGVTATAPQRQKAREQAYAKISQTDFTGAYYRKDIGL